MSSPRLPVEAVDGGVRVALRVTPRASRAGIDGVRVDAAGRAFLSVRVNAPPVAGKANAALIKLLAKAWDLSPSRLSVVVGAKGRRKTVYVAGDAPLLLARLSHRVAGRHG